MTVDLSMVVVRTDGLLSTTVDDEIVILNPARNNYVGLDSIGRAVWDLIESPCAVGDVCQRLIEDYDATADEIARDVTAFVDELVREGLVRVVEP